MDTITLERIDDDLQYHFTVRCNGAEFKLEVHPAVVSKLVDDLAESAVAVVGDRCHLNN